MDLNALASMTGNVTVDFMGQSANVSYKPDLLTQGRIMDARKADETFLEYFCDLVTAWDVKRGTKKVPLTPAGLKTVPFPLVRAIFQAIYQGVGGSEEEGNSSSGG